MIPSYRKILFATDLSSGAADILRHAIAQARAFDAGMEILHVLPEVDQAVVNYVATVIGSDRLADIEIAHKDGIARDLSHKLKTFARKELIDRPEDLARIERIEVISGDPASSILAEADRIGADLIIIGSHGKGRLEYAFLGSVAQKIMRRTLRPVLLVPFQHE